MQGMVEITSVESTWLPADTATISGSNFGGDTGYVNLVYENLGVVGECVVSDWTDTSITVMLPSSVTADEAVYLEVQGPATNNFTVRSEAAVTATPTVAPSDPYLGGGDWITLLPTSDLYPDVPLLSALGQIVTWDVGLEQYAVRWFGTSPIIGSPRLGDVRPFFDYVSPSEIAPVGTLTLNRAQASGLLTQERRLG